MRFCVAQLLTTSVVILIGPQEDFSVNSNSHFFVLSTNANITEYINFGESVTKIIGRSATEREFLSKPWKVEFGVQPFYSNQFRLEARVKATKQPF